MQKYQKIKKQILIITLKISGMRFLYLPIGLTIVSFFVSGQGQTDTLRINNLLTVLDSVENNQFYPYIEQAKQAYQLSKKNGYSKGTVRSALYLGIINSQISNWDEALKYLYEAEKDAENKYPDVYENALTNIAIVYGNTQNHEKSLMIYSQIRDFLTTKKNVKYVDWVKNYINTGKTYYNMGKFSDAIIWNQKALDISLKEGFLYGQAIAYTALSADFLEMYQLDSALYYGNKALELSHKNQFDRLKLAALQNVGSVYLYDKKYAVGIPYFEKAAALARKTQDLYSHAENLKLLSATYDSLNNHAKAILYLKKYVTLNDSIYAQEKRNELLRLETLYETEKKENKINELAWQNQRKEAESKQKTFIIIGILMAVLLASAIAILLFLRYKTIQKNITLQKERERAESELAALKAQMNPHFIFNSLNSIQEIFMLGDKNVAQHHLADFAELTRMVLNASIKPFISLEDEIALLKKYVQLESSLLEGDFTCNFIYRNNDLDLPVPPMLLQPLVENAIKHGLMHKKGHKNLKISFEYNIAARLLTCSVEDNGIGRAEAEKLKAKNKHASFSTSATQRRLQLLNNATIHNTAIKYKDLTTPDGFSCGTEVIISIPIP